MKLFLPFTAEARERLAGLVRDWHVKVEALTSGSPEARATVVKGAAALVAEGIPFRASKKSTVGVAELLGCKPAGGAQRLYDAGAIVSALTRLAGASADPGLFDGLRKSFLDPAAPHMVSTRSLDDERKRVIERLRELGALARPATRPTPTNVERAGRILARLSNLIKKAEAGTLDKKALPLGFNAWDGLIAMRAGREPDVVIKYPTPEAPGAATIDAVADKVAEAIADKRKNKAKSKTTIPGHASDAAVTLGRPAETA